VVFEDLYWMQVSIILTVVVVDSVVISAALLTWYQKLRIWWLGKIALFYDPGISGLLTFWARFCHKFCNLYVSIYGMSYMAYMEMEGLPPSWRRRGYYYDYDYYYY